MDKIFYKLTSKLLKQAADEFSNHSCNDFDLIKDGDLTEKEVEKVYHYFKTSCWDLPEELCGRHQHDSMLMDVLSQMFADLAKEAKK